MRGEGAIWVAACLLAALVALGACSSTPTFDASLVEALAKDPATAAVCIAPVPPYFGGFAYIRSVNNQSAVTCGVASMTPPVQIVAAPAK